MKYLTIIALTLILGLSSCQNDEKQSTETAKSSMPSALYNDSQIQSELFEINSKRDTTLLSKNGTTIKIYSNCFVTTDSSKITGPVKIEIKEAFKPIDFVSGNLTTISDNKPLVSGGMIYINATSGGKELSLKEGSEIGFFVPTKMLDEGMMIYAGERDSAGIMNWESPEPILNSELRTLEESYITITYQFIGKFNSNDKKFKDWLWSPDRRVGDKTKVDTVEVKIVDIAKNLVALRESVNGLFIPDVITNKGQNGFVTDYNTSYIFSVKKLGWANIDRLFDDPKAEKVEMLTTIQNQSEFGYVFTSLILPEQNMYIPGYQKGDNTFGFSHNDSEPPVLPVGAEAIIMATAYKGDKPYFSLKKIKIERNMNITFSLSETTAAGLKKTLEENI